MNPSVSIITVCFNSEKTIRDTIESVINQTYSAIEYILIDGASSDGTLDIIEEYSESIHTVISEPDNGMYDAINKGIELASGKYIGILNADDFYVDELVIAKVVRTMTNSNASSLYADLYYVAPDDTNKIVRYWQSGKFNKNKFLYGWMPPHPTFFISKTAYLQFGVFNLKLKSAADYELMLRMLYKYDLSTCYLKEVIVKMRMGGMSNVSLRNRLNANKEDKTAWEINNLTPKFYTMLLKPLRKIVQYFIK